VKLSQSAELRIQGHKKKPILRSGTYMKHSKMAFLAPLRSHFRMLNLRVFDGIGRFKDIGIGCSYTLFADPIQHV
jgi:hypothetical protein